MAHILVIDDEAAIRRFLRISLVAEGHQVSEAVGVNEGLAQYRHLNPDLVILDLGLPDGDGIQILQAIREHHPNPVLVLSARDSEQEKVRLLDAGANDYLAKPFHLAELEARIRSLTLRQFTQQAVLLTCGELTFDTRSRTAAVNGQPLTLTRKETGILEYLMVHQGRPVSQEELMEHVWDNSVDSFSNSIRVHISALRKKLRTALGYDPVRNRIGEGYLMGGDEE